jgi:alpha-ketoglutarate-dependent taurine dioxygenase
MKPESLFGKITLGNDFFRNTKQLRSTLKAAEVTIIPSNDGDIATVYESGRSRDHSHQTGHFDLHKDGLYRRLLPQFVLLYCNAPGRGDTPTIISDTRPVAQAIEKRPELRILKDVDLVYRSRSGREHTRPFIESHPLYRWRVMNLGARAYLRPRLNSHLTKEAPTLREITTAMAEVYKLFDKTVELKHFWQAGDFLLIDNNCFVHGREAKCTDRGRTLFRVWISMKKRNKD